MTKCLYDKRNKRNFNQVPWDTILIHDSIYQHNHKLSRHKIWTTFLEYQMIPTQNAETGSWIYWFIKKSHTEITSVCLNKLSCVRRYEVQEVWFKSVFYYIWWQLYKWIMTKFGISITVKCQGWFCHIVNFVNPNNSD